MYRASDIRQVHLEITTKCSVRCPQCPRNLNGGAVNPRLPMAELSLAEVQRLMPEDFVAGLNHVCVCGNYGDPTAARDTLDVLAYLRGCHPALSLQINSHGSARSAEWWDGLARLRVRCRFGIDGLADTNHIYRQGTDWTRIMRNVEAFIGAGGEAIWDFLVFSHNEHQVEAARSLSRQLGFRHFVVKKSGRFLRDGKIAADVAVKSSEGAVVGRLAPPSSSAYRNEALVRLDAELGSVERYDEYLQSTPIACKARSDGGIYISAEGLVLPCCYLGHIYPSRPNDGTSQVTNLLDRLPGGRSAISGLQHSIAEILDGSFFQENVPSGWAAGADARLRICAQQCGAYDMLTAQRQ